MTDMNTIYKIEIYKKQISKYVKHNAFYKNDKFCFKLNTEGIVVNLKELKEH